MAFQSPSMVRLAALRKIAFGLAKSCSIGLQVEQDRTGHLDRLAHAGHLVRANCP